MRAERKSLREVEALLWNGFEDFVINGDLFSFTDHAGIDLRGVKDEQIWDKFRAHYTRDNRIDIPGDRSLLGLSNCCWSAMVARSSRKRLTTQTVDLDLRAMKSHGWVLWLPGGRAQRLDRHVEVDWRGRRFTVSLMETMPHYGGRRFWFCCPGCGGRARILYSPIFIAGAALGFCVRRHGKPQGTE